MERFLGHCLLLLIVWCTVVVLGSEYDGKDTVDLGGDNWFLANSNGTIKSKALVPGSVYTDLIRIGYLGDPYFRFNDVAYRWVAYNNWSYSRDFQVTSDLLKKSCVELVAEGLDTIATIYINGKKLGETQNMFLRYSFDIKQYLKEGQNSIRIDFVSAVQYAADKSRMYPYSVPPACRPSAEHGECHFNFIRKEASSFGWDWGPAFPTMGIWKEIKIKGYADVVLTNVATETVQAALGGWLVKMDVYFDISTTKTNASANISVIIPELRVTHKQTVLVVRGTARVTIKIDESAKVSLWWPNGYGDPQLYDLVVNCTTLDNWGCGQERAKIGFRTIELVQDIIIPGSPGQTFYFKVNGQPIFMKGSNWIPADAFQERITPDYIRRLLNSAKLANMNMLRVWGGGVYESEVFYELADELGITLWQDMMFACAMYPSDEEFLLNVKQEIVYQIRRLKRHPSIVIWAGNNENEWGLAPYKGNSSYPRYYSDYLKLYKDTVATAIYSEDKSRPFVPSSPSNGAETLQEGWVASNPQSNLYGDIHHYDYQSDSWNWKNFPIPRFASEFGLQSWCSVESLQKVSLPGDLTPSSKFVEHRQHHTNGNLDLLLEISIHLNYTHSFDDLVYLSQINQAEGIKTETELYRRSQSDIDSVHGLGRTMGALYWQLNDVWQGPTWASLEYGGKWKMLHYFAKKFFAPEALSPFLDGSTLRVFYINDRIDMIEGQPEHSSSFRSSSTHSPCSQILYITCYAWLYMKPLKTWKIPFEMPLKVSSEVYRQNVDGLLKDAGCVSRRHCVLFFSLVDGGATGGIVRASNWLLLSNFTEAQGLQTPILKASNFTTVDKNSVSFTLTTDNIAPYVWMETRGIDGYFSDNGFLMVDKYRTIVFHSWTELKSSVEKALNVRSLLAI